MENQKNLLEPVLPYLTKVVDNIYRINQTSVLNELISKSQYSSDYETYILWTFVNSFKDSNKSATLKDWIIILALLIIDNTYLFIKHNTIYCIFPPHDNFHSHKSYYYIFDVCKENSDPIILYSYKEYSDSNYYYDQYYLKRLYDIITPDVKDISYYHINMSQTILRIRNIFNHNMMYIMYYLAITKICDTYNICNNSELDASYNFWFDIKNHMDRYINGYNSSQSIPKFNEFCKYVGKSFSTPSLNSITISFEP